MKIYKIQVPLLGKQVLIYSENHKEMGQIPLSSDIKKIMGNELKKYFYGKIQKDGQIQFIKNAPDQNW